ncbi:hypothetical protein GH714_033275 [Hevea brasiliensis]|uniref:Transposase-associated domain-containing protein n=1 Tax=Hevea brasiliensis TaxID=3981 RepID=A0A6A6NK76_HEVBR|nr:hypothetical protein GH714_033275 [Hevea brasiliensis]
MSSCFWDFSCCSNICFGHLIGLCKLALVVVDLHAAIKLCEPALVVADSPQYIKLGSKQEDMAPDKSWMGIENRKDPSYIHGVKGFLTYAFRQESIEDAIPCPCLKCRNINYKQKFEVRYHLLKHGILKSYTIWYFHGEPLNEDVDTNDDPIVNDDQDFDDDMIELVNYIYGGSNVNIGTDSNEASVGEEPKGDATMFYHLLREAKEKLHPECELSKLAAIDDVCEIVDDNEVYQEDENDMHGRPTRPIDNDDDIVDLNRVDVDLEEVMASVSKRKKNNRKMPPGLKSCISSAHGRLASGRGFYKGIDLDKLTNGKKTS